MLRAYFTLQNNQEFFDDPSLAIQDPTPLAIAGAGSTGAGTQSHPEFGQTTFVMPNLNGGIVPVWGGNASGGKQDVYMQAKWSYSVMGLYQFPYGINAAGTVYGRQGYPNPLYFIVDRSDPATGGPNPSNLGSASPVLLNTDLNANRNPSVHVVDLRAEKSFTYRGFGAIVSVDAFNVFNNNTILQFTRNVESSGFGRGREVIAPRIFRFGVRFQF